MRLSSTILFRCCICRFWNIIVASEWFILLLILCLSGALVSTKKKSLKIKDGVKSAYNLDASHQHFLGLIGLQIFYNISNITADNNVFKYRLEGTSDYETIEIPIGTYKADDPYLKDAMIEHTLYRKLIGETLEIYLNNYALRTHPKSSYSICFAEKKISALVTRD